MSKLIDEVTKSGILSTWAQNPKDGKWYIAKPLPFYGINEIFNRIKDAGRVISGKSFAVHYKEDDE